MPRYYYSCPHCQNSLLDARTGWYTIGSPIRSCSHCQREYCFPYVYEWSILNPLHKLFYCFVANSRSFPFLCAAGLLIFGYSKAALLCAIIWAIICVLRLKIFDAKKIEDSRNRTKDNPQYIRKLSDLGCTNIDLRIDPFYR